MKRPTRPILLGAFALIAMGPTASYAETVLSECQEELLWECYQAQKGRNIFVKWGVGLGCTIGLGACAITDAAPTAN